MVDQCGGGFLQYNVWDTVWARCLEGVEFVNRFLDLLSGEVFEGVSWMGGKNGLVRASLFSALDVVYRGTPSWSVKLRVGIFVRLPSVGGSVPYLFAVHISFSDVFVSQSSQCSFLVLSISAAYFLVVSLCCW